MGCDDVGPASEKYLAGLVRPALPLNLQEELTSNKEFLKELAGLINKYSKENGSNTPDFILAGYLANCLELFDVTVNSRAHWYGREDRPGQSNGN